MIYRMNTGKNIEISRLIFSISWLIGYLFASTAWSVKLSTTHKDGLHLDFRPTSIQTLYKQVEWPSMSMWNGNGKPLSKCRRHGYHFT